MKLIYFIIMAFILVVGSVSAQNEELAIQQIAGEVPGSIWYQLDLLFDNIKIAFAQDKIKARFEIMDERIAEMKVMIDRDKLDDAERIKLDVDKLSNDVKIDAENKPSDIKLFVQENLQKSIVVLEKIREKLPEKAQIIINRVIEQHKENVVRITESKQPDKEGVEAELDAIEEKVNAEFERIKKNKAEGRMPKEKTLFSIYGGS